MSNSELITVEDLRDHLAYCPNSGVFTWRKRRSPLSRVIVGQNAGTFNPIRRQIVIGLDRRKHCAHRLAWLYMTGKHPKNEIDHIDGDPKNNSFSNLREATRSENARNQNTRSDSTTGFKSVGFDRRRKKYRARISVHGKEIWLGYHDTADEAHAAYCEAAHKVHGAFANTGKDHAA